MLLYILQRPAVILVHGWLAAGKSTLLGAIEKDPRFSGRIVKITEHNIADKEHRELLSYFYDQSIDSIIWESWQLFSYWDAMIKTLKRHSEAEYIFSDRSFLDVMNFVSVYLNGTQAELITMAYQKCLEEFIRLCTLQHRRVIPVHLCTSEEQCWRQFIKRDRVEERAQFTFRSFIDKKRRYDASVGQEFSGLHKYREIDTGPVCRLDGSTPGENIEKIIKALENKQ